MRVYELAKVLGQSSEVLLGNLRADGEWIASHLSVVPAPVIRRYLPTDAVVATRVIPSRGRAMPVPMTPQPTRPVYALPPRPKRKLRPGPEPITMRAPERWDDEYAPYHSGLRYEPELTTRDVAELLSVQQATVRQWVKRGHIKPSGKHGCSYFFDADEVRRAHDLITSRHKAAGTDLVFEQLRQLQRLRRVHAEALLTVTEAGLLVGVAPSTIRSWIHRGHLTPAASPKVGNVMLRLDDVISAAQGRGLPRPGRRRPQGPVNS